MRERVGGHKFADPGLRILRRSRDEIQPWACKLFGSAHARHPDRRPSDGACAAHYNYAAYTATRRPPLKTGALK